MSLDYQARSGLTGQVEDPKGQRIAMRGDFDRTQSSGSVSRGDDLRCQPSASRKAFADLEDTRDH